MTITPEEQIWTVVRAIADGFEITPSGETLLLDPKQFSKILTEIELKQVLKKLEKDEKTIEIKGMPSDLRLGDDSGCYLIVIPDQESFRELLNRAHSRHYGDVNRLAAENFFAVCDVAMDICEALQITDGNEARIPLMRDIIRFNTLMPADGINMRDRYCDYRWRALMYLRDRKHIVVFDLDKDIYEHRWNQKVNVVVDRYDFDKFYKKLIDAYQRRVVEPQKKEAKKTPKKTETPSAPPMMVQKIEITAMPELRMRNVEDEPIMKGKKRIHLPKFKPTDWAKITIRFVDERNVLITAGDKEQVVADYEALGFADDKRGKPNTAWAFLLGLARHDGETETLPTPIPDTVKQQKLQLSQRLKAIFKNESDPFNDTSETGTYKIKITLIPPQMEQESTYGTREFLVEDDDAVISP